LAQREIFDELRQLQLADGAAPALSEVN
jgi:hypothetical protein